MLYKYLIIRAVGPRTPQGAGVNSYVRESACRSVSHRLGLRLSHRLQIPPPPSPNISCGLFLTTLRHQLDDKLGLREVSDFSKAVSY